ncbi:MAG TPA: electron transfer flavoprotein subunit beta/FixA family protein [Candidatus Aminicenantes bacterium]|nr:electron transfer flavoprotein subunit beta/FixA family protein [Candidatus Aminicenantes bacterium]
MHFIVCIKQVPNTIDVDIDARTGTLKREGVESIINPFDEFAIEEGVRLKERTGGKTTVITMGPPQAESALREALARGIDRGILITDRAFAGADTWATAYTLARAVQTVGAYDLIICGKQASDGDTAQVGPGVAEMLDIPHAAYVKNIDDIENGSIRVERMMEDGHDLIEMPLPALITVVKEINVPRPPSLRGTLAARKAVIEKWDAARINAAAGNTGLTGSPTQVIRIFNPPPRRGGEMLTGSVEEMAEGLVDRLKKVKIS